MRRKQREKAGFACFPQGPGTTHPYLRLRSPPPHPTPFPSGFRMVFCGLKMFSGMTDNSTTGARQQEDINAMHHQMQRTWQRNHEARGQRPGRPEIIESHGEPLERNEVVNTRHFVRMRACRAPSLQCDGPPPVSPATSPRRGPPVRARQRARSWTPARQSRVRALRVAGSANGGTAHGQDDPNTKTHESSPLQWATFRRIQRILEPPSPLSLRMERTALPFVPAAVQSARPQAQ